MPDPLAHPRIRPLVAALRPVWADLGVVPDREIAQLLELSPRQVTCVRELACIPPAPADLPSFERQATHLRRRTEMFARLSDREIGSGCGVRPSMVRLYRAMHGLPTSDEAEDGTAAPPDPPFEPWMRLVGLVKDSDIAHRARRADTAVRLYRARHLGLPRLLGTGWADLPPWKHAEPEPAAALAPLLRRAAARPELRAVQATDPRFALWFRSVGSPAADLAEAIAGYADLDVHPMARKVFQLHALVARLEAFAVMGLDEELRSLAAATMGPARAVVALARFGLDGEPPRPSTKLREILGITHEGFRHGLQRFERSLEGQRPWLPAFDRFAAEIDGGPPRLERLTAAARAHGSSGTWRDAEVEAAARLLGRSVTLQRRPPEEERSRQVVARALISAPDGPFTVERALAVLTREGVSATPELVLSVVEEAPAAEWLIGGAPDGWFWFPERAAASVLVHSLWKLVAVGPVALVDAAAGSGSRRYGSVVVPPEVMAAVVQRTPGLSLCAGVVDADPLPTRGALSAAERVMVSIFERRGPVVSTSELQHACADAGLHPANAALTRSPLVRQIGRGCFVLRPRLRGSPAWSDLATLARLAVAAAQRLEAERMGIRVSQGTWDAALIGEDVDHAMRALADGAEAVALARRTAIGTTTGVYVVAERAGACVEAWAPDGGAARIGQVAPIEEPIWFGSPLSTRRR